MSNEEITADIVIAGGGAAGCVVAGRLADAFPDLSVVIIEQGSHSKDNPLYERPLPGVFQVYAQPESIKYYQADPSEHSGERGRVVPTGNVFGGGTCINWLVYQNPAKSDLDDWNMSGWSFDELLPTIYKSVRYEGPEQTAISEAQGAMPVTLGGWSTKLGEHVDQAFHDIGMLPLSDMADFKTGHGYGRTAKWIGKDGYRSHAAKHYIYDKDRPNLTILTGKTVNKVLIEDGKAVGVEVCDAPKERGDVEVRNVSVVKARKKVIVSAGALGTPGILERSGLGNPTILSKAGVQVKVDLPSVGVGYQDHPNTVHGYKVEDLNGLDGFGRKDPEVLRLAEEEWTAKGTGILSTSLVDLLFKLRPTAEEIKEIGPEFEAMWKDLGQNKPDKPLVTGALGLMHLGDYAAVEPGYYLTIANWINYSASRGSIHINDTNPHIQPTFVTGFLSHPADVKIHKWTYKKLREVVRHLPCYLGENQIRHPVYPAGSKAAVATVDQPHAPDDKIEYTAEDDEVLEAWIRDTAATTFHSMGTCPMKPKEKGGVVDANLDVYGVENLKIADLSICPSNVGCNTTSVALMIGEKCAEIVEAELRKSA